MSFYVRKQPDPPAPKPAAKVPPKQTTGEPDRPTRLVQKVSIKNWRPSWEFTKHALGI